MDHKVKLLSLILKGRLELERELEISGVEMIVKTKGEDKIFKILYSFFTY